MDVLPRWPYYRGDRKAGFHCNWTHQKILPIEHNRTFGWLPYFKHEYTSEILVNWNVFMYLQLPYTNAGNPSDSIETECLLIFMPFCLSAEQNRTNCVDLVWLSHESVNQTHRKVPVRLCSITEIERLGSIEFDWYLVRFRLTDYAGTNFAFSFRIRRHGAFVSITELCIKDTTDLVKEVIFRIK